MPRSEGPVETNRIWLFSTSAVVLTIGMGFGGIIYSSLQNQIEDNSSRIWAIKSTAVTEDKLDRQVNQVKEYIDVRIQSIEGSQREIARQLNVLSKDVKSSYESTMVLMEKINNNLEQDD